MNSAFRRSRNLHFVEFFLEPARVAGWKFQTGEEHGGESEIRLTLDRDGIFSAHIELAAAANQEVKSPLVSHRWRYHAGDSTPAP